MRKKILSLSLLVFLLSCSGDDSVNPDDTDTPEITRPNILLIIADDMGKDATSGFDEGTAKPTTPTLDGIKNNGLVFENLWVYPTCSPTRASIISGKIAYHTGVKSPGDALPTGENILQNYINEETDDAYATAIVGKWHLAENSNTTFNPESLGLDYYAGILSGGVGSYTQWQLTEDGERTTETTYVTEKLTDMAIEWTSQQSKPWFMWLAYNAPHTPFHAPPSNMHSQGDLPAYVDGTDAEPYYMAAIEAMDFQIGRLLDEMTDEERDNTIIIFIGDNGSPGQVAQAPYSRRKAKGSLYQGGINTPMFVSGYGVSRTGLDENLIMSSDLFATIAGIAGINTNEIHNSINFQQLFTSPGSHRTYQYSEMSDGTVDTWTIRNDAYKLIENSNGDQEFYFLSDDPYENEDLLQGTLTSQEEQAKTALENELTILRN